MLVLAEMQALGQVKPHSSNDAAAVRKAATAKLASASTTTYQSLGAGDSRPQPD